MQKKVRDVLRPFKDMWTGELGSVKVTQHRIKLKPDPKPVFSQPYRAGPKAREVEEQEVNKMLDADVIERAKTEWATPVVLVPKSDGSLRFCMDYRRLKALTVRDSYPLPRMDECLDSLGDVTIFTTLHCNTGYWQIQSRTNTATKLRLPDIPVAFDSIGCLSVCVTPPLLSKERRTSFCPA